MHTGGVADVVEINRTETGYTALYIIPSFEAAVFHHIIRDVGFVRHFRRPVNWMTAKMQRDFCFLIKQLPCDINHVARHFASPVTV